MEEAPFLFSNSPQATLVLGNSAAVRHAGKGEKKERSSPHGPLNVGSRQITKMAFKFASPNLLQSLDTYLHFDSDNDFERTC